MTMLSYYIRNFPDTKFKIDGIEMTRRGQADQIVQEAAEIFSAAEKESDFEYVVEILDCIHACETALSEFDPDLVDQGREYVIDKNKRRGYYTAKNLIEFDDYGDVIDFVEKKKIDLVNHPSHYTQGGMETIDIIEAVIDGLDPIPAFRLAHVLRYAQRAGLKDDALTDLQKANNYAHRLVAGHWRWEHDRSDREETGSC